jgi:hypothetical protein
LSDASPRTQNSTQAAPMAGLASDKPPGRKPRDMLMLSIECVMAI